MKRKELKYVFALIFGLFTVLSIGQVQAQDSLPSDTVEITKVKKKSDRNVMLNAGSSTGPRNVNIGLPASVGGTTIMENGLPVVFFFWPEFPIRAWRIDASSHGFQLLSLGETAMSTGEVGFSVSTYDNLGTDIFRGNGSISANHFGMIQNTINISGPINKKGLSYSAGAYTNLDPGTFKPEGVDRYFKDKTHMYKLALTQKYQTSWIKGSTSVLYKYVNSKDLRFAFSPFIYRTTGKVKELSNFRLNKDSYYERSGRITLTDGVTGENVSRDIVNDYGTNSNTFDLISKNTLSNGLNVNLTMRYHHSKSGVFMPYTSGIDFADKRDNSTVRYEYEDGSPYTGDVQGVVVLASRKTPTRSFFSQFDIGRKSGNHNWKIGVQESYYRIDKFITETGQYNHEVAANPAKLFKWNHVHDKTTDTWSWKREGVYHNDKSGNFNENWSLEYHDGHENKHAIFLTDKWDVSSKFQITAGARFEYHTVRGNCLDRSLTMPNSYLKYKTINQPKLKIRDNWFKKAFMLDAVYKITDNFGLLAEAYYNEQAGQLESYSSGADPQLKKSKIPEAGIGLYYNSPLISLVSKANYITRDEYRATVNFFNPKNKNDPARPMCHYDIETIGWTTDAIIKPFKGFELHLLFTLQSPKYKNFSGDVKFKDGTVIQYDYSDKSVAGISKMLIEIDPSYSYKNMRVWASARYFGKQYMNKPNTLKFAPRWETFAGMSYKLSKNVEASCSFVNLLNQKGATGSVGDADLILTADEAAKADNTVVSGSCMRPFTVEFGLKFNF